MGAILEQQTFDLIVRGHRVAKAAGLKPLCWFKVKCKGCGEWFTPHHAQRETCDECKEGGGKNGVIDWDSEDLE